MKETAKSEAELQFATSEAQREHEEAVAAEEAARSTNRDVQVIEEVQRDPNAAKPNYVPPAPHNDYTREFITL